MLRKLPIVAVFGQGTLLPEARTALAREVGAMVARLGAHLLTGGGYGVMEAAAQAFTGVEPRAGFSIGIIPRKADGPFDMPNRDAEGHLYPNAFVEIAVMTPLPPRARNWQNEPARNHINVFTADAVISLPGGAGTRNELDMVAHYATAAKEAAADRAVVLLGPPDEFATAHREHFFHTANPAEAERHVCRALRAKGFMLDDGSNHERTAS